MNKKYVEIYHPYEVCPFFVMTLSINEHESPLEIIDNDNESVQCVQENCAMWNKNHQCCGFSSWPKVNSLSEGEK